jgi:hypothetical protein
MSDTDKLLAKWNHLESENAALKQENEQLKADKETLVKYLDIIKDMDKSIFYTETNPLLPQAVSIARECLKQIGGTDNA